MTSSVRPCLLPILAGVLLSTPSLADEFLVPVRSVRVRVTVSGPDSGPLVGRLLEARDDTLTVVRGKEALDIPFGDIERVEVGNGFRRATARGALIGLVVLGGAGAFLAANSGGGELEGLAILLGTAAGAVNGAAGGALVGSGYVRERWEEVPRSGIRVGPDRDVWMPIPRSQPVRVTAHLEGRTRWVGTEAALAGDSLVLRAKDRERRIPASRVTRVETTWSRKSRSLYGTVIGFAAGFVAGVMLHGASRDGSDAGTGVSVGLVGAPVGALVGAQFEATRWEKVPLRPPPLRPLGPRDAGPGNPPGR